MNVSDSLELTAYKRAIEEVGHAGWTTCQMFINNRVKEIQLEMANLQKPCKVLKPEYIEVSPKYDAFQPE
jgi:hypothetical protein